MIFFWQVSLPNRSLHISSRKSKTNNELLGLCAFWQIHSNFGACQATIPDSCLFFREECQKCNPGDVIACRISWHWANISHWPMWSLFAAWYQIHETQILLHQCVALSDNHCISELLVERAREWVPQIAKRNKGEECEWECGQIIWSLESDRWGFKFTHK